MFLIVAPLFSPGKSLLRGKEKKPRAKRDATNVHSTEYASKTTNAPTTVN